MHRHPERSEAAKPRSEVEGQLERSEAAKPRSEVEGQLERSDVEGSALCRVLGGKQNV
jgi:hypothetical protein